MKDFGKFMQEELRMRRWSQSKFARLVGWKAQNMGAVCRGERGIPRYENLRAFAFGLGYKVSTFIAKLEEEK